ncbi:MAG: hypothetical protein IJG82_09330 [Atopobiaceae bacterium]|nr:hypothetical protein [Atopobiaceae bacterium]
MSRQKDKGTRFETDLVEWLRENGFPDARREVLHGSKDAGDIGGVTWNGWKVVIEAKDCKQLRPTAWLEEAEEERKNAGAAIAFVVAHRKGCGEKRFGENYAYIDLTHLATLMNAKNYPTGYAILRLETVAALLRGDYE